jgi:hypothetical protein
LCDDINLTEEYEVEIARLQKELEKMPTQEEFEKIQRYD